MNGELLAAGMEVHCREVPALGTSASGMEAHCSHTERGAQHTERGAGKECLECHSPVESSSDKFQSRTDPGLA
jgi:hypothetical protein